MVSITLWFTLGTLGMVIGTGLLAYGYTLVPSERRRPFLLVISVPAIAAVAYALMAVGVGGLTTAKGTTAYLPRYVDWLLTTPLNIAFVALLAGASTEYNLRICGVQASTIVFGFVGAMLAPPWSYASFAVGAALFGYVIYSLYGPLDRMAATQTDGIESLFEKLRSLVVVLWLVYPVIWLVGPAGSGIMDIETTSLVVAYIDVVSKVGFGLITLNDYVNLAEVGAVDVESQGGVSDEASTAAD